MRRILISLCFIAFTGSAAYADRPFSWSGFYAGAHVGYAWGDVDQTQTSGGMPFGPFSYKPEGAFSGATAGYNWQFQNLVVGVEGDFGYMDLTGAGVIPSSVPGQRQDITLSDGLYATATGRIGYAFGQTLIYGKGGVAYYGGEGSQKTTNPGFVTYPTGVFTGWVYGGGIEHFIARNWSLKIEYLHFDFGGEAGNQTSITDPPVGFVYTNNTDVKADTVKLGVNFHF